MNDIFVNYYKEVNEQMSEYNKIDDESLSWYRIDTFNYKDALGDTIMEKYESLYVKLMSIFNKLKSPLWVICGHEVASIFEATCGFKPEPCPEDMDIAAMKFYKLGRVNNNFDVYVDCFLKDAMYVCGQDGVRKLKIKDFLI